MMTSIQSTRLTIEQVERVEVGNTADLTDQLDFAKREITVWTKDGERYEFILVADTPEQLDFVKHVNWLEPKLYEPKDE